MINIPKPKSKQPIPNKAKRVFKGKIFDVYQWRQKMFDGSYEIFEKVKRVDTVNIIPITEDKKIIILKQAQPGEDLFLSLAGGRVDWREDILKAAERELLEETGYCTSDFILWEAIQPFSKIEWSTYTFIAKGCKKIAEQKLDSGEKIDLMFVGFEEFISIAFSEKFRDQEVAFKLLKELIIVENHQKFKNLEKLFIGN